MNGNNKLIRKIKTRFSARMRPASRQLLNVSVLLAVVFILLNFFFSSGQAAQAITASTAIEKAETQWYLITLGGQKIGYIKESGQKIKEDGRWFYKSYNESKMSFNRLGKRLKSSLILNI